MDILIMVMQGLLKHFRNITDKITPLADAQLSSSGQGVC